VAATGEQEPHGEWRQVEPDAAEDVGPGGHAEADDDVEFDDLSRDHRAALGAFPSSGRAQA
jgi:hypothetical protein